MHEDDWMAAFQGGQGQDALQAQLQTELQAAADAVSAAAWSNCSCVHLSTYYCSGGLARLLRAALWARDATPSPRRYGSCPMSPIWLRLSSCRCQRLAADAVSVAGGAWLAPPPPPPSCYVWGALHSRLFGTRAQIGILWLDTCVVLVLEG